MAMGPFSGIKPINIPRQTPAATSLGETLEVKSRTIFTGRFIKGIISFNYTPDY